MTAFESKTFLLFPRLTRGRSQRYGAARRALQSPIFEIFAEIEKRLADKTKFEAIDYLRKFQVPCAPVPSMKELAYDPFMRANGSIFEVPHKKRGSYLLIHSPVKFSEVKAEITGSPLLGKHIDEVVRP